MLDNRDININLSEISKKTLELYILLCKNGKLSQINKLDYETVIELTYMISLYPISHLDIDKMEYYLCSKYENTELFNNYLIKLIDEYQLKYLALLLMENKIF